MELDCCLYVFCQYAIVKIYYVGGEPFVYTDIVRKFSKKNEFLSGSALEIPGKKIIFANKDNLYLTNGVAVDPLEGRNFAQICSDIGASSYLTTWVNRQCCYVPDYNLYLLPLQVASGTWGQSTCSWKVLAVNISTGAMWVFDWNFNAITNAAGTDSTLIALSPRVEDTSYKVNIDRLFHMDMETYKYVDVGYSSYYQSGLYPLNSNLDQAKDIKGLEFALEATDDWNLTVSIGNQADGLDSSTKSVNMNGSGMIRGYADFLYNGRMIQWKIAQNTKDQYYKICGFPVINWKPIEGDGDFRR